MAEQTATQRMSIPGLIFKEYGTLSALFVLIIIFGILKPSGFLTIKNTIEVLQQIPMLAIVAIGLTYPLTMGNVDLSVGYLASLSGVTLVSLFGKGFGQPEAIITTIILVGGLGGLLNGVMVTFLRIPSLVVTIGTGFFFFGLTWVITGGTTLFYHIPPAFGYWGSGRLAGVPVAVIIMIIIFIISYIFINRTSLGRYSYAIGNNETAAELAGVNVKVLKLLGFVISGICASMAGIILASKTMVGHPTAGDPLLMKGLAAAFIGTSIFRRGEGNIWGTIVGALIIGVVYNGMTMIGTPYFLLEVMTGTIFIATLALSGVKLK